MRDLSPPNLAPQGGRISEESATFAYQSILASDSMDFQTHVRMPQRLFSIGISSKLLLMGSCFAQHVGERMVQSHLDCLVNPFGVLYNPFSICQALELAANGKTDLSIYLLQKQGEWGSWLFSTQYDAPTRDTCLQKTESALAEAHQYLREADVLVITLGTNHVYRLRQNGLIVANCHKMPAVDFEEVTLTLQEVIERGMSCFVKLREMNPKLHILLTVSPYRYQKYGFHGSRLSKSVLLLACEAWEKACQGYVNYFPAYEIMEDELRDYRYYASDMLHPSEVAVDYIWERFCETYLSEEALEMIRQWLPIRKGLDHRTEHPESPSYQTFMAQLRQRLEAFGRQFPAVGIDAERAQVNHLMHPSETNI